MRSERLLRIIARLQGTGRMTAAALAHEFDVSVKTIQRDMDALSSAGIPVYAVQFQSFSIVTGTCSPKDKGNLPTG